MVVVDASSFVHAWDNYPVQNFPKFWQWVDELIEGGEWVFVSVTLDEIEHVSPDARAWLNLRSFAPRTPDQSVLVEAVLMKQKLGIVDDVWGGGVDENDLLVIAAAKVWNGAVLSNEAIQRTLPTNPKNYKIPAVCGLATVSIDCADIAATIKVSNRVF